MGEEAGRITGAARGQKRLLLLWCYHVVVDVGGQDSAPLQKDPATGSAESQTMDVVVEYPSDESRASAVHAEVKCACAVL